MSSEQLNPPTLPRRPSAIRLVFPTAPREAHSVQARPLTPFPSCQGLPPISPTSPSPSTSSGILTQLELDEASPTKSIITKRPPLRRRAATLLRKASSKVNLRGLTISPPLPGQELPPLPPKFEGADVKLPRLSIIGNLRSHGSDGLGIGFSPSDDDEAASPSPTTTRFGDSLPPSPTSFPSTPSTASTLVSQQSLVIRNLSLKDTMSPKSEQLDDAEGEVKVVEELSMAQFLGLPLKLAQLGKSTDVSIKSLREEEKRQNYVFQNVGEVEKERRQRVYGLLKAKAEERDSKDEGGVKSPRLRSRRPAIGWWGSDEDEEVLVA